MKLLEQLRQKSQGATKSKVKRKSDGSSKIVIPDKVLYELTLNESIRYRDGDPVSKQIVTAYYSLISAHSD